jgi:predicted nucleotide-binding protein (sugar kinase/HSP70/actin superfamily)
MGNQIKQGIEWQKLFKQKGDSNRTWNNIAAEFAAIPVKKVDKIKVGIVGEIYMKYSPLGNNNLEEFLQQEDVEVVVPGLMDFIIYTCDNGATDAKLYGINRGVSILTSLFEELPC